MQAILFYSDETEEEKEEEEEVTRTLVLSLATPKQPTQADQLINHEKQSF